MVPWNNVKHEEIFRDLESGTVLRRGDRMNTSIGEEYRNIILARDLRIFSPCFASINE